MYNAEIKNQYLEENKGRNLSLVEHMTRFFKNSELSEIRFQCDLSCFSIAEIIEMYKSLCSTSLESIMVMNSQFLIYTGWCLKRNLVPDNQNHYQEMTYEIMKSCINHGLANEKIVSREDLLHIISDLNNPSDQLLALALFEGIYGKESNELLELNLGSIDGNKLHLCTGRTIEVSSKLIELIRESCETYEYNAVKVDGDSRDFHYSADDSNAFKRMYNSKNPVSMQTLRNKLVRMNEYTGSAAFSFKGLIESGRISMIRNYVIDTGLSPEEVLIQYGNEISYRYGNIYGISRYLLKYKDKIVG